MCARAPTLTAPAQHSKRSTPPHTQHLHPQVYLGAWECEWQAALAYDLAAVLLRGGAAITNFALSTYAVELADRGQVRGWGWTGHLWGNGRPHAPCHHTPTPLHPQ